MNIGKQGFVLLCAVSTLATPALAERVTREGVIMSMAGGQIHLRTREGQETVVVSPSTKIRETAFLSSKHREHHNLMTGLIVKVSGEEQGGTLAAEDIAFKEKDWRSAVASHASSAEQLAQHSARIQQNEARHEQAAAERSQLRQAIIDGHEYVVREEVTVLFATGSAAIAEQYKSQLLQLARKAPSHGNYRISVLGFADPRGDAAANERLSARRALAVSNFLRQSGHIQPGRVLSPSAMGEGATAPGDKVPGSHDEARRVIVRVVTPKTQLK